MPTLHIWHVGSALLQIDAMSICISVVLCKGKYRSTDNTKYGKGKGKLLLKNEEISGGKAHTIKRELIRNISTITDIFPKQNRLNVCEHTVKMG